MFHPSLGGYFSSIGIVVVNKGAEQNTAIFDVAVDRTQKPIAVNVVDVGFVVFLLLISNF